MRDLTLIYLILGEGAKLMMDNIPAGRLGEIEDIDIFSSILLSELFTTT